MELQALFHGPGKYVMFGGIGLVAFLALRNRSTASTGDAVDPRAAFSVPEAGTQNPGTASKDDIAQALASYAQSDQANTAKALEDAAKQNAQTTQQQLAELTTGFNQALLQQSQQTNEKLSTLSGSIAQSNQQYGDKLTELAGAIRDTTTQLASRIGHVENEYADVSQQSAHLDAQFSQLQNTLQTTIQTELSKQAQAKQPVYQAYVPAAPSHYENSAPYGIQAPAMAPPSNPAPMIVSDPGLPAGIGGGWNPYA